MPSIGSELIDYLKTIPAITDLVGFGLAARIYENIAKQTVKSPFIIIVVYTLGSEEHLTGISGMASNRIEVNCYSTTPDEVYELAEAVRLAPLQLFRGQMGSVFVNSCTSDGGYETGYDPPTQGGNTKRYFVSRDYNIYYSEPVTS